MQFLEKDLEQIIYETENEILDSKGLYLFGKKLRQLRIGNYGVADIVVFGKDYDYCHYSKKTIPFLNITVLELKKEKVGISAFLQSIRYCKGIKTFIETKKPNLKFKLNIILASKEVDMSGDFIYLTDLIGPGNQNYGYVDRICYFSFKYDINGIIFKEECNYNLIHKGF